MEKWEYLNVVSHVTKEGGWEIFTVNGKKPNTPILLDLPSSLDEWGKLGWELVSENYVRENFQHKFYWRYIFNESNTTGLFRNTCNPEKTMTYFNDQFNDTFKNCQIVGILPNLYDGMAWGWFILFSEESLQTIRRFTFKRPLID